MDLNFPESEAIDSRCHRRVMAEDSPGELTEPCKGEAVTYFETSRGVRLYVCESHAREILRFGEGADDLPDDYNDLRSYASKQGVNMQNPDEESLRRRLLVAPDAAELPEHPTVTPCRDCLKLTLVDDVDIMESRCPKCRGETVELDLENTVVSTG